MPTAWSSDENEHPDTRYRQILDHKRGRQRMSLALGAVGAVAVSLLLIFLCSLRVVPPASVAVVTTLGSISDDMLSPGMHVCNPLASVTPISTQTQLLEQANHVPTKEGVTVELDVAVLYHIEPESARDIYLSLGANYDKIVIEPELASAVRGLTSEAPAAALYTSGRAEMQSKLQDELANVLISRGIVVESVLLKGVVLPDLLKDSIEKKAQAEQEAERMQFVLQREQQEAERKKIEAGGIAEARRRALSADTHPAPTRAAAARSPCAALTPCSQFQRIVSEGISPEMLMWKGIEVTHEIATSNNAKIVMIGNSKESLPVILGDQQQSAVGTTPAWWPSPPSSPSASPDSKPVH